MTIKDILLEKLKDARYVKIFNLSGPKGFAPIKICLPHNNSSTDSCDVTLLSGGSIPGIGGPGGINVINGRIVQLPNGWTTSETIINQSDILSEVETALDTISKIDDKNNEVSNYNVSNSQLTQDINSVSQQISSANSKALKLHSQVDPSRPIEDTISSLNLKQKTHILFKALNARDVDSKAISSAIMKTSFDPHYIDKNGYSIVDFAIKSNDVPLFEILVNNGLDFNHIISGKTVIQLVLGSGNESFLTIVFGTNQDLTKSIMAMALNGDDLGVEAILKLKPEFGFATIHGEPLVHCLLSNANYSYKTLEKMLDIPGMIEQVNSKGFSPIASMILRGNKEAAVFLRDHGANISEEVKKAVNTDNIKYLMKIIDIFPEMLNESYEDLPLGHFVLNCGSDSMLASLVQSKPEIVNFIDSNDRNLVESAISTDKILGAKFLMSDPLLVFVKSVENNHMDVALKIISIDEKLLSKLMDSAHTEIAKTVLTNDNLLKFNDINGDSLVHIACRNGNQEMVRFILDKDQLSLDVQNNYGKTPLHVLLESELDNVTKQQISNVILALHPNVNLQDLEHHTPVDIAMNNAEILSVFYEHGLLGIESTKIDEFI